MGTVVLDSRQGHAGMTGEGKRMGTTVFLTLNFEL